MIKQYSYLIETIVFCALTLWAGSIQGNPAYIGHELHPFYLVILVIVLRYGYVKGFFVLFITSTTYIIFYVRQVGSLKISDLWGDCYQPLAFLAFGMFVGLLINRDKEKIESLYRALRDFNKFVARKNAEIEKILTINKRISDQLVTSDQTFNIVFHRTKTLFSQDTNRIYETAYDLLMHTVKASKGYVFSFDGSEFQIACPRENVQEGRAFLAANKELIENIRISPTFVRLDEIEEERLSEQTAVFVGPIIHQVTNTLYGMLAVEELDFFDYNESSFVTFTNLCQWIGEIFYFRSTRPAAPVATVETAVKEFHYLVRFGASRPEITRYIREHFYE